MTRSGLFRDRVESFALPPLVFVQEHGSEFGDSVRRSRSIGGCGPDGGNGFESGVDAEGPKETADVVPDCLGAQLELSSDLLRRAALL